MAQTECPRCLAERRAAWSLGVGLAAAIVAFALAVSPEITGWMTLPLVLAFVIVSGSGLILYLRHGRYAAMPHPVPPADPLAHYREGKPLECPRHPFAR